MYFQCASGGCVSLLLVSTPCLLLLINCN
jgi:hypothetical protein